MILEERIFAFDQLGKRLSNLNDEEFDDLAWRVENNNSWFTKDHTKSALVALCSFLELEALKNWITKYRLPNEVSPKNIGILMAGNVPGVGFHDLLCVLITGHKAHVKLSSSDSVFISWIVKELLTIEPRFESMVSFEEMLKGKDAYIATGSDNSARYFEYYFGKYPSIIRKNRTSVAVLTGQETDVELLKLGKDVFQYFGLGCRNVSKIFVPDRTILTRFLDNISSFQILSSHHKYINNYDYNKSIYLINGEEHLDNGFLLLKESKDLVSPIAVLFYEIYEDNATLGKVLKEQSDKIQCIVSQSGWFEKSEPFGQAQCPKLDDFADDIDTIEFLINLK
ncbi:acyl-CoA reductase [Belliella sp. DSM 111904]|uniref:Acyl-CoA reductase n=1 Tax=Belliella filtrata TaxID=2923435 RepID=A0ABS9V5D6_9BACT|nr:acyl-CoA reductase [Belliella filtrata]MCH7411188.1 acyl-CoA reductase [Belliella filtrata]